MEYIGIGVMIAIGIYIAPFVVVVVFTLIAMVVGGLVALFGGSK